MKPLFKMFFILLLLVLLACGPDNVRALSPHSILTIPLPGAQSHARIMFDVSAGLASRGHDVWILVDHGDAPRYSSFAAPAAASPKLITYDTGVSDEDWREGKGASLSEA